MKKVGIMSMQRIANYGSFLQAYGLQEILKELGVEIQFVDYHPGDCLIPADGGHGVIRKITKGVKALKHHAPLREKLRFIQYKKNYASNYYSYLGIVDQMNFSPELDVLIIGSDEVFNCVQNNTNVGFSPELFGENNHAKKLISYAASFGNTTLEKLGQYKVDKQVTNWLENFDAISVRDANSGKIVMSLTGKEPDYHLDPVLAYDFINKCNSIPENVPETKYMILYGYSGRFSKEECKAIREYSNKKKIKVFCIGGVQDCCDKFIICSPFQVIAYFQHAEVVVTDTFHGTILSVITHGLFTVLIRENGYGNTEKLTDLLERLRLSNRVLKKLDDMENILAKQIEYDVVDVVIAVERKRTYAYLKEQIF